MTSRIVICSQRIRFFRQNFLLSNFFQMGVYVKKYHHQHTGIFLWSQKQAQLLLFPMKKDIIMGLIMAPIPQKQCVPALYVWPQKVQGNVVVKALVYCSKPRPMGTVMGDQRLHVRKRGSQKCAGSKSNAYCGDLSCAELFNESCAHNTDITVPADTTKDTMPPISVLTPKSSLITGPAVKGGVNPADRGL